MASPKLSVRAENVIPILMSIIKRRKSLVHERYYALLVFQLQLKANFNYYRSRTVFHSLLIELYYCILMDLRHDDVFLVIADLADFSSLSNVN